MCLRATSRQRVLRKNRAMLLYVTLGSNDLERAGAFYDRALAPLGLKRRKEDEVESVTGRRVTSAAGFGW